MSHYASRQGGEARPESVAAVKNWGGTLSERELGTAAADRDLDLAFGMVLRQLDELKVADNTYVIFTTDHGTPGRNPPLSGGKGTIWEGGLRVPLILRGPGIKPGACCHVRTVGVDLFPTIAQLGHVTAPQRAGLEGGSLVPLLLGGGSGVVQRPREDYVVHFPHYDKDSLGPASSVLWGDYKLIRVYETGQRLLFNLAQDPGERRDLAGQMSDKVQELDVRLTQYLESVHAQLPTVNARKDEGSQGEFRTDVPDHPLDIVLGRPTQDSITLSVLAYRDLDGYVAFGTQQGKYTDETPRRTFPKGQPVEVVLASLTANTRYHYQFRARDSATASFQAAGDGTFHTARPPSSPFTFTITADLTASCTRRSLSPAHRAGRTRVRPRNTATSTA